MTQRDSLSKPRQRLSGILYMTGASLAFALMAVCVKLASETLPVLEVVFFRSFMGMLMISLLMLHKGVPFWGKEQAKLILRGLSGFVALTLHFITIAHLPLGMAVMLNYTAPIYVAILAVLFLQEKPGFFLWAMIFLSFAGVYLLTNPGMGQRLPASSGDLFYVVLGLLSGLAAAVAYTAIRAIRHRESPLTIIFYFTLISTAGSSVFLLQSARWPRALEWLGLAGVAVGSFYGQLWMTIAFRKAPASLVSPFSYLTPAFAFLAGFIVWKDPLTARILLGAGLIFLAGCWITLREAAYE